MGNGETTKFWEHCWVGESVTFNLRDVFPMLYSISLKKGGGLVKWERLVRVIGYGTLGGGESSLNGKMIFFIGY